MAGYLATAIKRWRGFTSDYSAADFERRIAAVVGQSKPTILAHWGTVLAIVVSVGAIYLRDVVEDKAFRQLLLELHRQLGLLILIIVPIRIGVRWSLGFTDHAAHMPAILRWSAKGCHVLLYACLVINPIIGWAATNAHHVALTLFGLVALPPLVAPDPDLADVLVDYHVWGFYLLVAIVVMHVSAALWHHYILRDGVLIAMLRARRARLNLGDETT
jgi:cytochrome b561